jgi:hypothetical protein
MGISNLDILLEYKIFFHDIYILLHLFFALRFARLVLLSRESTRESMNSAFEKIFDQQYAPGPAGVAAACPETVSPGVTVVAATAPAPSGKPGQTPGITCRMICPPGYASDAIRRDSA